MFRRDQGRLLFGCASRRFSFGSLTGRFALSRLTLLLRLAIGNALASLLAIGRKPLVIRKTPA